jgi:hypothetical protein
MDLREIEWSGMDWNYMAQDRDQSKVLVNTVLNSGFHNVTDHYFPASLPNIMSYYRIIMSRTYYQFWIKSDLCSVLL